MLQRLTDRDAPPGAADSGEPRGQRPRPRLRVLGAAGLALFTALAFAASAQASVSATLAPIDSASSGSYLLTVTNGGAETEGDILIATGGAVAASSVVPSTCVYNQPVAGQIGCPQIPAGGTLQVCYTGPAVTEVAIFYAGAPAVSLTTVGPVGSCPLPGFVLPTSAGPTPGGGSGSPAASGITIGKVTSNAKKGTAKLVTKVPQAGTLKLSGKGVKGTSTKARAAGSVTLTVKASGKAAKTLAATGKVTLKVSVTFTPSGGSPVTGSKTVKLVKAAAKK